MYQPYDRATASPEDRVAWAMCQIIDDDAPINWTRYRFAGCCIAGNPEVMSDLNELKQSIDVIRTRDNPNAAPTPDVVSEDNRRIVAALEYLRPNLESGTFTASDWAIDLGSILTGGTRLTPQPELTPEVEPKGITQLRQEVFMGAMKDKYWLSRDEAQYLLDRVDGVAPQQAAPGAVAVGWIEHFPDAVSQMGITAHGIILGVGRHDVYAAPHATPVEASEAVLWQCKSPTADGWSDWTPCSQDTYNQIVQKNLPLWKARALVPTGEKL